jgi:hypothetical protein
MSRSVVENFFSARASRLFASAVLLAPLSVAGTALVSLALDSIFTLESIPPNSVAETAANGLDAVRVISALILAPIVENLLCLLWAKWLPTWDSPHNWWGKPCCIALIAAAFHALVFWDIRPFAVFPGFFIIAAYIVNTKNGKVGYWSSVVHHACINVINLSLVILASETYA